MYCVTTSGGGRAPSAGPPVPPRARHTHSAQRARGKSDPGRPHSPVQHVRKRSHGARARQRTVLTPRSGHGEAQSGPSATRERFPTSLNPVGPRMAHASVTLGHRTVLVGDMGVGKSSIGVRFVNGEFVPQESTIGGAHTPPCPAPCSLPARTACRTPPQRAAAFITKTIPIEGKSVKFDIWDTSGQGAGGPSGLWLVLCLCTGWASATRPCSFPPL